MSWFAKGGGKKGGGSGGTKRSSDGGAKAGGGVAQRSVSAFFAPVAKPPDEGGGAAPAPAAKKQRVEAGAPQRRTAAQPEQPPRAEEEEEQEAAAGGDAGAAAAGGAAATTRPAPATKSARGGRAAAHPRRAAAAPPDAEARHAAFERKLGTGGVGGGGASGGLAHRPRAGRGREGVTLVPLSSYGPTTGPSGEKYTPFEKQARRGSCARAVVLGLRTLVGCADTGAEAQAPGHRADGGGWIQGVAAEGNLAASFVRRSLLTCLRAEPLLPRRRARRLRGAQPDALPGTPLTGVFRVTFKQNISQNCSAGPQLLGLRRPRPPRPAVRAAPG